MTDKAKILNDFISKWANLPEQKSAGWYASRIYNIGASEMSTIQGINKYQDIRRLINMHCGLVEFGDKTAVNWGNVMEHVITIMTEKIFDCKITEMGSIPTAGIVGQRCSPDGVSLVKMLGNLIVSFEFKAPKNRLPHGRVPSYYLPQVYSCLQAVEPADIGIFVDVVIRRCTIEDWTFSNTKYDWDDYHKKNSFYTVVAKAVVYFYSNDPHENDPIDLGSCAGKNLDNYLSAVAEHKMYNVKYGDVHMSGGNDILWGDEITGIPTNCVAYLPIKVMNVCIVPVQKIPKYVNQYQNIITKVIDVIRKIMEAPDDKRHELCNALCNENNW